MVKLKYIYISPIWRSRINKKYILTEKSNGNPLGVKLTGNMKTKFKYGSDFVWNSSSNKALEIIF